MSDTHEHRHTILMIDAADPVVDGTLQLLSDTGRLICTLGQVVELGCTGIFAAHEATAAKIVEVLRAAADRFEAELPTAEVDGG